MADPIVNQRICCTCKRHKPLTEFNKNPHGPYGHDSQCRPCKAVARAERYRFRPAVSEKRCLICERIKPASSFFTYRRSPDGLHYQCKDCARATVRTRKYCPRCETVKPIEEFSNNKRDKDGYHHYCKPCSVEMTGENYWTYHEKQKKYRREYVKRPHVRAKVNVRRSIYRRTPHGSRKTLNHHLKRTYGIGLDIYESILNRQGGVCAICGSPCRLKGRLSVDHDHATGQVRGLLCNDCNVALGRFDDNPELLRRAIQYLASHGITGAGP